MSKKSKKSAERDNKGRALDRPFAPEIEARARQIGAEYSFVIQPNEELGFLAHCLEMPLVMADGKTEEKCIREIHEAMQAALCFMLESGETPPPPATERKRQEQVNIRLTAEEKLLLETAAQSRGFRGISDFIRSTTLAAVR